MDVEADDRPDILIVDAREFGRMLEAVETRAQTDPAPADRDVVDVGEQARLCAAADLGFQPRAIPSALTVPIRGATKVPELAPAAVRLWSSATWPESLEQLSMSSQRSEAATRTSSTRSARKRRVVSNGLEQQLLCCFVTCPLSEILVGSRTIQKLQRLLSPTALRGHAGPPEEHGDVVSVGGDPFLDDALELVDVAELASAGSTTSVLPGSNPVRLACGSAYRKDDRPLLLGLSLSSLAGNDEDARACARVDGFPIHDEGRASARDEVELLVNPGAAAWSLVVPRHDYFAGIGAVRTDAEGLDPELGSEWKPRRPVGVTWLHVVEVQHLHRSSTLASFFLTGEHVFV